jgi:O-antigen ligase
MLDKIIQMPTNPAHNFSGCQTIDKFNATVTNATQFVDNEDSNKKQPSGTASERFILWKVAINTARKHPFFGSGSGDFRLELERFTAAYPDWERY